MPQNWRTFMSNIHNKNELVFYVFKAWKTWKNKLSFSRRLSCIVVKVTLPKTDSDPIEPPLSKSSHNEPDTGLILHALNALQTNYLVVITLGTQRFWLLPFIIQVRHSDLHLDKMFFDASGNGC